MTEKILCAVDFSETSRKVVNWAIAMAQQLKTHVTLLHAYRLTKLHNGEAVLLKRKMEEEASDSFKTLEKELLMGKDISYDFKSEVGFVTDRVEGHAKSNSIGFVVMGKKTYADNRDRFDELSESMKLPLFIVP